MPHRTGPARCDYPVNLNPSRQSTPRPGPATSLRHADPLPPFATPHAISTKASTSRHSNSTLHPMRLAYPVRSRSWSRQSDMPPRPGPDRCDCPCEFEPFPNRSRSVRLPTPRLAVPALGDNPPPATSLATVQPGPVHPCPARRTNPAPLRPLRRTYSSHLGPCLNDSPNPSRPQSDPPIHASPALRDTPVPVNSGSMRQTGLGPDTPISQPRPTPLSATCWPNPATARVMSRPQRRAEPSLCDNPGQLDPSRCDLPTRARSTVTCLANSSRCDYPIQP
jgi:hypothetical protein